MNRLLSLCKILNLRENFTSNHSNCVAIVSITFAEDREESTENRFLTFRLLFVTSAEDMEESTKYNKEINILIFQMTMDKVKQRSIAVYFILGLDS